MSKGTIIRTTLLALAIVNNALLIAGKNPLPFENEQIAEAISYAATVITALAAWWKNNSFTGDAIAADNFFKKLKGAK